MSTVNDKYIGGYKMNTNVKGTIGIAHIIVDLTEKGYEIFTPLSEHSTVDLIAIKDNKIDRIQVKYREPYRNKVEVPMHTVVNGKRHFYNKSDLDLFAVYCPQWGIKYVEPRDSAYFLKEEDFR
jgi:hypothetical protein